MAIGYSRALIETREQFFGVKADELLLAPANLMDIDLVKPGVDLFFIPSICCCGSAPHRMPSMPGQLGSTGFCRRHHDRGRLFGPG
jgi:hypothetical protein